MLVDASTTRYQDLACSHQFLGFLTDELLPWSRQRYRVTPDPRHITVAGVSLGGLSAAFAALESPDIFGKVSSLSGDFRSPHPYQDDTEPEWLARHVARSRTAPIQFYLEAGSLERHGAAPSLVVANRHLRDVLEAKNYPVEYREVAGEHDPLSWRGGLANGIVALAKPEAQ